MDMEYGGLEKTGIPRIRNAEYGMRTEVGHGGRTRGWGIIGPGYGEIRGIHKKDKIYSKFG
ncbi:hypothetical protein PDENDC454_23159 [Paenibacillus dendritiformis C454]|uniref:Uncharacterized protein n=1 Tax=Paenibacillus dendritiformis C454 TaxID=1131935 RepID=H3SM41_9BACL|nr:hypothetical protein PDENDC454_23159 [Paenibacillus dendritiformis C454]